MPWEEDAAEEASDAHIKSAQIQSHFKPLTHGGWGGWGGGGGWGVLGGTGGLQGQQDWNTVKARPRFQWLPTAGQEELAVLILPRIKTQIGHISEVKTMPPE